MDALINTLSLIVGALIASGVGLLTHWLEKRSDRSKLKLRKIEELHVLFKELYLVSLIASNQYSDAVFRGEAATINSKTKDEREKSVFNYYRIASLVDMYCPELRPELRKFIEERNKHLETAEKLKKEFLMEFYQKREEIRVRGNKFSEKIVKEARKYI